MRSTLPKLSREAIEKFISQFKENNITFSEFTILLGIKDTTAKTEVMKHKAQQKWVRRYIKMLKSSLLNPMKILKEADVNEDGILDIKELEDVLKKYLVADQVNYNDLQHIMDAFDINNDGKVTTMEYKTALVKYGFNRNVIAPTVQTEKANEIDVVAEAKQACKNSGTTLKEFLSSFYLNDSRSISVPIAIKEISKQLKMDKKDANDLVKMMQSSDEITISARDVFNFYEKHLPDDTNIEPELKYILLCKELELSPSIPDFLEHVMGLDKTSDILLKEFAYTLDEVLGIQQAAAEDIYQAFAKIREEATNPSMVEFYALLLLQRDKEANQN